MLVLATEILPELSREAAFDAFRAFFREKPFLFFGTGMSCAVDIRFGMPALRDALQAQMRKAPQNSVVAQQQWEEVDRALQTGKDLESAMDGVSDESLLGAITSATGNFIADLDREYGLKIAQGFRIQTALSVGF